MSKSILAFGRRRLAVAALTTAAIAAGAYGLYAWHGARPLQAAAAAEAGPLPDRVTRELAKGTLAAFLVHPEPKPVGDIAFRDEDSNDVSLGDWKGRVVLVNLWATWCGPCRKEMPELAALQQRLGSDDFQVVAINVDRQGAEVARPFLDKIGAQALDLYVDPTTRVLTDLKAVGLPATVLIDRQGREIGRMFGPAEWASPEAVRLIETAVAAGSGS